MRDPFYFLLKKNYHDVNLFKLLFFLNSNLYIYKPPHFKFLLRPLFYSVHVFIPP